MVKSLIQKMSFLLFAKIAATPAFSRLVIIFSSKSPICNLIFILLLIYVSKGLGSSASHHLVEGIARAGNGTALFASLEEKLEKKVLQQLQDAMQPALTGLFLVKFSVIAIWAEHCDCFLDVVVHWDGYDSQVTEKKEVPVETKKTLLGYGKPVSTEEKKDDEIKLFRQAPRKVRFCLSPWIIVANVIYFFSVPLCLMVGIWWFTDY